MSEVEYVVDIKMGDKTFTSYQWLPRVWVNAAKQPQNQDVRKRLSGRVYTIWRRTFDGKLNDDGVPFSYEQLTITEVSSPPEQPSLFDI